METRTRGLADFFLVRLEDSLRLGARGTLLSEAGASARLPPLAISDDPENCNRSREAAVGRSASGVRLGTPQAGLGGDQLGRVRLAPPVTRWVAGDGIRSATGTTAADRRRRVDMRAMHEPTVRGIRSRG